MSGSGERDALPAPVVRSAVCVEFTARGAWEVEVPDQRERITCTTLDEAQRIAYLSA